MKNSLFLILLTSLIGFASSCKKDEKTDSIATIASSLGYDGHIEYTAFCQCESGAGGVVYKSAGYNCFAQFFTDPSITYLQNVGKLLIGTIPINPDTGNGNTYWFSSANRTDAANAVQFGNFVDFKIAGGGGYTPSGINLYVPKEIYLDTLPFKCCNSLHSISISKLPYRVYWNKDDNNKNGVVITPQYNGTESHRINSAFSSTSYFKPKIQAAEIGYYDLTASDISGIPTGSVMTLHLSRSNSANWIAGSQTVSVNATAETSRSFIIAP